MEESLAEQSKSRGLCACSLLRSIGHLLRNPLVSDPNSLFQRLPGRPAQLLPNQPIVRCSTAHSQRARNVPEAQPLAGDLHDHMSQFIDGDHIF